MKLNAIDLNKLNVFCAVVENQGYRDASERLGLTRSAISQAIAALEAQIGILLFNRSGTRLFPTDGALRFYEEVMRYQRGIEVALGALKGQDASAQGLIRIGAYLEFTKNKLMPAIESFLVENPHAQIQFHFDSPSRLENLLERGRIDLSVSIFPHQNKKISSEKLFDQELCLVGRKDLISQNPTDSDLFEVPVIDYFPSHVLYKRWWAVHFSKKTPRFKIRAYAATAEIVLELVNRRLGVGVIPRYLLASTSEKIHIIAPTSKKLVDHLWISKQRGKKASHLELALMRSLRQALEGLKV